MNVKKEQILSVWKLTIGRILLLFKNDTAYFFTITMATLSLGFLPMLLQILHTPSDKIFPLIHNSPHDYYFYLALMNQGANGRWLALDPYTIEPTRPSFIGSFFVILGKVGHLFSLPHPIMYNLTRLLGAFLLMAVIYLLFSKIFNKTQRKIAFLFYALGGSWLRVAYEAGTWKTSVFMEWWTGIDISRRHVFLPHHLLAYALLALSFYFLIRFMEKGGIFSLVAILIAQTVSAFMLTPTTLVFLVSTPGALGIYVLRQIIEIHRNGKKWRIEVKKRNIRPLFIQCLAISCVLLALLVPLFIIKNQIALGFPWSQYTDWETGNKYPVQEEILGALGILLPFALVALPVVFSRGSFALILLASWAFVPFMLMPIGDSVGLSPIRLTQGNPFIPLAGLAAVGISYLGNLSHLSHLKHLRRWLLLLVIVVSIPAITRSVYRHTFEFWVHASNTFLSFSDVRTFSTLAKVAKPEDHVLGSFFTSNTAASYAYTKMFIGSYSYTKDLGPKEGKTVAFLKGEMTPNQAKEFLKENTITYLVTVNHDNWLYGWPGNRYPQFLQPIYEEGTNGVYKVRY